MDCDKVSEYFATAKGIVNAVNPRYTKDYLEDLIQKLSEAQKKLDVSLFAYGLSAANRLIASHGWIYIREFANTIAT